MYKTYLDNGYDEVEVEVEFDYQPYEPSSWGFNGGYPGCDEAVDICEVKVVETQAELCLLKNAEYQMREEVMDFVHDEQEYSQYGYMME